MQITDAAVFYSRLTKWDQQFDNQRTRSRHIGITRWRSLVRLTESRRTGGRRYQQHARRKIAAIRCYKTQFGEFEPEKQIGKIGAKAFAIQLDPRLESL